MDANQLRRLRAKFMEVLAGAEFSPREASELLKDVTEEIMLRTRRSDGPEVVKTDALDEEKALHRAERYLDAARLDVGKSPCDENFIDCLDNLIQHLKTGG